MTFSPRLEELLGEDQRLEGTFGWRVVELERELDVK